MVDDKIRPIEIKVASGSSSTNVSEQKTSQGKEAQQKKKTIFTKIAEFEAGYFPDLKRKLRTAELDDNIIEFLEKTSKTALMISVLLVLVTYLLLVDRVSSALAHNELPNLVFMIMTPLILIPPIIFYYLMLYPDAAGIRRQKDMDYEIVFAGRHMVIALKSGMPLFDTIVGASNGYGPVSKEFSKIADQVVLGTPIAQAIRDVVQYNPSKYFTRVMVQLANAISSGADVGSSLENVLDQISKEQLIALKEYSQKLTPIVMFYMIFGIIIPSLGIVLATVVFSAISGGKFGFSSGILVVAFFMIATVQFLFLGFVESSRPKYLL